MSAWLARDGVDGAIEPASTEQGGAETVALGHDERQAHRTSGRVQRPRDVCRRFDRCRAAAARPGDDERALRVAQGASDLFDERGVSRRAWAGAGRAGIEHVRDIEAKPRQIVGGAVKRGRRDVVQPRARDRRDEERALRVLHRRAYGGIVPFRNVQLRGDLHGLAAHRLAEREGEHRRGVGHVLPEHQDGVRLLDVVERRRAHRSVA